ncbi:putative FAD-linked oxidoreductase YvdP [Podospora australis]|uniref:FAD-linked oxidoreductase YvdP n=1 Tax=Podospora australis TaxID=1536484 RepID=A0AAN7AHS1_9PEZI|nr:putative FAD-linked oxidoreductase YvdP [Podospora australis]
MECKNWVGSPFWPSRFEWDSFNTSVSGRLIKPVPPASVCHPSWSSSLNEQACMSVQDSWNKSEFHANDPVSVDFNNWTNDTCLPSSLLSCSDAGYPAYVVNASSSLHVKAAVDFARKHEIRLVVKASGHDYLGRSSAPGALSIWVRYLHAGVVESHADFQPSGCNLSLDTTAVTVGGGTLMKDLLNALQVDGLATVAGASPDVAIGGYLTGGGHSVLSATQGLAADNVLQIEMVTPQGDIVTANECQNNDLFWAVRGGGGGTFGVVTKATLRTFTSPPVGSMALAIPLPTDDFLWETTTKLVQATPGLAKAGISGYMYAFPEYSPFAAQNHGPVLFFSLVGVNQSASQVLNHVKETEVWAELQKLLESTANAPSLKDHDSYYTYWFDNVDKTPVGTNFMGASRLLNVEVLTSHPFERLKQALKTAAGPFGLNGILGAGLGVWNAHPRGGGNAVNPAWRNNTVVHLVLGSLWMPGDAPEEKEAAVSYLDKRTQVLRELAPDSGCYVNEAFPHEPDFPRAFWGDQYEKLERIKREIDPTDVFWCHPCVGNQGWKPLGERLCRV